MEKTESIVYVCLYQHKHGTDVGVYATYQGALSAASQLMFERVEESWEPEDAEEFYAIKDAEAELKKFHDVENNISEGESIEILERPLGE